MICTILHCFFPAAPRCRWLRARLSAACPRPWSASPVVVSGSGPHVLSLRPEETRGSAPRQSAARGAFPARVWESRGGCFSGDPGGWGAAVSLREQCRFTPGWPRRKLGEHLYPVFTGRGPRALLLALLLVTSLLATRF